MENRRERLVSGHKLFFENDLCIEIDEAVGSGGVSLTYYGREMIPGQESVQVLIKELFPDELDFYRDHTGKIIGRDEFEESIYEDLVESFYYEQELGNQIALRQIANVYPMKQVMQETVTGNYYGLFYQCPPSITLKTFVEKAGNCLSLCGKLKLIHLLGRLVQSLHEDGGYCHNDISGGNVIITGTFLSELKKGYVDWSAQEGTLQVGLIDFAHAAKLDHGEAWLPDEKEPMRFHTDGFSAPELYEMHARRITVMADVYSVTACLWFLLTGKKLETEDGYPVLTQREWRFLEECIRSHELCALSGDVRFAFEEKKSQSHTE